MNEQFKKHGAFSWSELMTTDIEAAKAFYSKLFGWTLEDMPMEGMTYTGVVPMLDISRQFRYKRVRKQALVIDG